MDFFSSIFGITLDRRRTLKWIFPQEKAALHVHRQDHANSENALAARQAGKVDFSSISRDSALC
jgi:hypothetical protein